MTPILAFDPGVGEAAPGGMCLLQERGRAINATVLPTAGKIVDVQAILRWLTPLVAAEKGWRPGLVIDVMIDVVIERQHARPEDGHRQLNACLPAYGQLIGLAQAFGWPLTIVQPKDWKAVVLRGTTRDKAAACAHVATAHPTVDLRPGRRTKPLDGIADAVCIAEWRARTRL